MAATGAGTERSDPLSFVPKWVPMEHSKDALRAEVREFLERQRTDHRFTPRCDSWLSGWDEHFSRELGRRGWLGMSIPSEYGGQGRSALDRYVVTEELLAAGAPIAAHWFADRQTAPTLLRYGTEYQKLKYLPGIAQGQTHFAIGLSEPDSGSDLASIRTKSSRFSGGWRLTGSKVWTSGAHRSHFLMVLARAEGADTANRHSGLTQFIVDVTSPGISIRPILLMNGEHHFNEVVFDDVIVPDEEVLGGVGDGWRQVTAELAYERSGPERWLSTFPLLRAVLPVVIEGSAGVDERRAEAVGTLVGRIWTLRQMSLAVAGALSRGELPDVAAALVKDLGTRFESELIDAVRLATSQVPDPYSPPGSLPRLLADAILQSPGFTLRGGTNEILRNVIAKQLELK